MISVIVTKPNTARDLHALLSSLVHAAAEGLVRQVLVLDGGSQDGARELCEDAGADLVDAGLAEVAAGARGDWLLVLPADLRLRRGWDQSVAEHLEDGGGAALVMDASAPSGWLARLRRPVRAGVLMKRSALAGLGADVDLERLRRHAARGARLS